MSPFLVVLAGCWVVSADEVVLPLLVQVRKQLRVEAQVLNSHLLAIHLAEAEFVVLKASE